MAFFKTYLHGARFLGAQIDRADFRHAILRSAVFRCHESTGRKSSGPCTAVANACFRDAILGRAKFAGVEIKNSDFSNADLSDASFESVSFENVVFPKEQQEQASFDDDSSASLLAARRESGKLLPDPCLAAKRLEFTPWKQLHAPPPTPRPADSNSTPLAP